MRYIKFLVASVALILATACVNSEVDDMPIIPSGSHGDLQIVGRITQYSDCDVATRSKKEGDEPKVTSMGLALFPIDDDGTIGNCLYYDYKLGGSIVFIVDRKDKVFDSYVDKKFAMYIFANMQDAVGFPTIGQSNRDTESGSGKIDGVGKSLDYFTKCATAASENVEDVPANGFPMMGSLGNTVTIEDINGIEPDGKTLILKPAQTDANVDGLPTINGIPTDNLEIPLKSMYAKFTFTISVKPDQEIVGNKAPRFDLLSYEVHNIPATVDSNSTTNDSGVIASSGEVTMGNYAQGATTATFDFYLPERYFTPSITNIDNVLPTELKKGTYGTDVDSDQNGYRDEDEKYHQRYKNLLVEGKSATYVTITGKYNDHQGHTYDVDYNIYLGGNNRDDFNIIRNTHYDNSVTIRGISASDDQATNTNGVAIDWRVTVDRSTPLVINLRRESLLDAHFEVRPLRLRLVGENIPTGTSATVSILNEDGTANNIPAWIRMEVSGNTTNHITTDGVSKGKRKYFTTDLVTNTLKNGTSITVNNLSGANQTLWIYVDENIDTKPRAAVVRITYQGEVKDYKIVQNGLYAVKTTRNASIDGVGGEYTYYIEQYEEYLYNYDAEDSYGQTEWNGMEWGLNGVQLSNENPAIYLEGEGSNIFDGWSGNDVKALVNSSLKNSGIDPKYDFYLKRDNAHSSLITRNFEGWQMNVDIQEWLSTTYSSHQNTGTHAENNKAKIEYIALDEDPKSAYAYCYNRNKRDANGKVAKVEWYLPAIDEIEDIVESAHGAFKEFQNNLYWSCQPAYLPNKLEVTRWNWMGIGTGTWADHDGSDGYYEGIYYIDDTSNARSTKASRQYDNASGQYIFVGANSGADIYQTYGNSIFYLSSGVEIFGNSAAKAKNETVSLGTPTLNTNRATYEGNKARTSKARVRCVRKMN